MRFNRHKYLQQLIDGEDNGLVKIVTGIRRCGKSFLLFTLFKEHLLAEGVGEERIVCMSFDDIAYLKYRDPFVFLEWVEERGKNVSGKKYVLLDEVQLLDNFVQVLLSLLHKSDCDIYVTGSNSRFLSSDVVTEFRGRGDEIRVWPLAFAEYYEAFGGDRQQVWKEYYTFGGLPQAALLKGAEKKISYLKNLFETTYFRDIMERNALRNDVGMQELVKILASSIGSPVSIRRIANTFKSSSGVPITEMTIRSYIKYLQDAFIVSECCRWDIKGRKYIGGETKQYFTDLGIRGAILDYRQQEETHIMENVIYNELRVRGYQVDVGNITTYQNDASGKTQRLSLEVDFVAGKGAERIYIQSAYRMPVEGKVAQELRPLAKIPDSFRKVVIVGDDIYPKVDENGVRTISLMDFLLNDELEMRGL